MIAWAAEALVASTMLMLAVLLTRGLVRRAFGPQIAYALWALPVLRLLLPPLPAGWREQAAMPISRAGEAVSVLIVPAADTAAPLADAAPAYAAPVAAALTPGLAGALPWGLILAACWAAGALAFFVWHFVRHRHFCRGLLSGARVVDEIDGVRVVETPAAAGPLAFGLEVAGLGRRFVAFPDDFADRYDADERELALAHELGHHARGDLFANWIALAVLALHWFNPLAWRAFRAFRADQELANDARVLAGRSRTDRHIYACAIVKAAHGGAIAATCHLHTITDLKGRLKMLTISRVSRTRLATGAAAVVGLVAGGLIVTASGTQAAAALSARVGTAAGVAQATPPVPPVPAAPGGRTTQRVVIVRDGKSVVYDGEAAARYIAAHPVAAPPVPPTPPMPDTPAMPAMPAMPGTAPVPPMPPVPGVVVTGESGQLVVTNADCQPAEGPTVIDQDRNGRRTMVVCRNRVRAMADTALRAGVDARVHAQVALRQASEAERRAGFAERQGAMAERRAEASKRAGMAQAIAGIRMARRSIEANRALSDDQRRAAMAGLDDAMAELRSDGTD